MSVSKPQNREEFKKHILTKLGAPVLEINVASEQLDIAIDDAFQFYNERSHFYGTETGYLVFDTNTQFMNWFKSHCPKPTKSKHPCIEVEGQDGELRPAEVNHSIWQQNNYITLPEDVIGVTQILTSRSSMGVGGGVIPPGAIFPILLGGINGDNCGNMGFGLSSFFIMQGYLALIQFLMSPPTSYNFNQRTHRLALNGDLNIYQGGLMAIEVMVKPSPDIYPDLWNDMWLKQFTTALVKAQWGRNLTKYQQVQMPGGITLNGQQILADANKELEIMRERFAWDFADPPTAIAVG
jgi:hypothetical protein